MGRPALIAVALLLVFALVALVGLQWKHELGGFADSPQLREVPLGMARIVGGGRAVVDFVAHDGEAGTVRMQVRCAEARHQAEVPLGDVFEPPTCGVDVVPIEVLGAGTGDDPVRLFLEVRWPPAPR